MAWRFITSTLNSSRMFHGLNSSNLSHFAQLISTVFLQKCLFGVKRLLVDQEKVGDDKNTYSYIYIIKELAFKIFIKDYLHVQLKSCNLILR